MHALILFLYRLLTWAVVLPFSAAVRNHPNFKGTIRQRLALTLPDIQTGKEHIWIHCASLGEVKAASLLVEALKKIRPELHICISSMTSTGRDAAAKIPGVETVFPFPFDIGSVMRRYLNHLKPSALVIMETEIWPNMIAEAKASGVKVIFVNARMSYKSARNLKWIRPLLKILLSDVTVLAISDEDACRFSSLGAGKVEVIGNIKFDAVRSADPVRRASLKSDVSEDGRPVFIAGSIREGEERFIVDAIKEISSKIPGIVSIIAPRHPDRIGFVTELLRKAGLSFSLRSSGEKASVILVDTMGELFDLYGASDVAFVGGSLLDLGGQNILEPVSWGVPVVHGPFMSNFKWALDIVGQWTVCVENPSGLGTAIIEIFNSMPKYQDDANSALDRLSGLKGISMNYARSI